MPLIDKFKQITDWLLGWVDNLTINEYSGRIFVRAVAVSVLSMISIYCFMLYQSTSELNVMVASIPYEYSDSARDDGVQINELLTKINKGEAIAFEKYYVDIIDSDYLVWLDSEGKPVAREPKSDVLQKVYLVPSSQDNKMTMRIVVNPIKPKAQSVEFLFKTSKPNPYGWLIVGVPRDFFDGFSSYTQVLDGNSVLAINSSNKNNLIIASNKINVHDYNAIVDDNVGFKLPLYGFRIGMLSGGLSLFKYETFTSASIECKSIGVIRIHSDYLFMLFGVVVILFWSCLIFNRAMKQMLEIERAKK